MRKTINKLLATVLVVIMSVMVINVLWQVFSRFILNVPSAFTEELARYLMIWLGVLGAAYVAGQNAHVAIDLLPSKLSQSNQTRLKSIVRIAIILFALVALVCGGSRLVYITYALNQNSPALGLPLAFVYAVLPLSGLLIIYYKIADFYKR